MITWTQDPCIPAPFGQGFNWRLAFPNTRLSTNVETSSVIGIQTFEQFYVYTPHICAYFCDDKGGFNVMKIFSAN